jgi:SM-20-related protein
MTQLLSNLHQQQGQLTTRIADEAWIARFDSLAEQGYVIVPNFLPSEEVAALFRYTQSLNEHDWALAGVGREQQHTVNTRVRSDQIRWLQAHIAAEAVYLNTMDELRVQLNRRLFMGLFDYECHLARYQPGAFYQKHLDAFKGRSNRVLTTVFYLNSEWRANDGGELVIYGEKGQVLETVLPEQNTLVVFLSDVFVHEVKTAYRERFSITGWFRHNTSHSQRIDPAR